MPGFRFDSELISIHFAYDGMTTFPHFKVHTKSITLAQAPADEVQRNRNLARFLRNIKEDHCFDRFVPHLSYDHLFYLNETPICYSDHHHIKFGSPIDEAKIRWILESLEEANLISKTDIVKCAQNYREYHLNSLQALRTILIADIDSDTTQIIRFISHSNDNDLLNYLSQELDTEEFDYLRTYTKTSSDIKWQGIDALGHVAETSFQWAMIQKAFSLQLAKNIQKSTQLNTDTARERADQLRRSHTFFALKRKTKGELNRDYSSTYFTFYNNQSEFSQKYIKYFNKF